jgi:hypothetical protein
MATQASSTDTVQHKFKIGDLVNPVNIRIWGDGWAPSTLTVVDILPQVNNINRYLVRHPLLGETPARELYLKLDEESIIDQVLEKYKTL